VRDANVSKATVLALLHDAGVQMRRQGLPANRVAEAARLYEDGQPLSAIAEQYGVSVGAVYSKLRAHGVQMRDSHGRER
jgi:hypothetical protein